MSDYLNNKMSVKNNFRTEASTCNRTKKLKMSDFPQNLLDWVELNGFDLIIVCDSFGKIDYVSQSVTKILGYYPDKLVGDYAQNYLTRKNRVLIRNKMQSNPGQTQKFTLTIRDVYGKYVRIESTITTLIDENSGEELFVSLSKDITDKKEAEEMLIRSEKMSVAGQLAAGVAHEIRNPLTSIKGFIHLLQSGVEKKDEYFKIMVDEINKIETITSELLFISKPMTDERKAELPTEMLNDVITLLHSQARLYNINIELEIKEKRKIHCDRTQIKQVFINLIKNAIEEMKSGGVIKVEVDFDLSNCYISIIDEGPGIPDHIFHKLKEPFFTTKKDGTGLGLMISNKIIENHQGKIDVFRNEKVGSTFRIKLPINSV